jgi:hypothetical protein
MIYIQEAPEYRVPLGGGMLRYKIMGRIVHTYIPTFSALIAGLVRDQG